MLLQHRPTLTPNQVKQVLKISGTKLKLGVAATKGITELNVGAALAASATATATAQSFAQATGWGSVEAARGSNHVLRDNVALTGEFSLFGPLLGRQVLVRPVLGQRRLVHGILGLTSREHVIGSPAPGGRSTPTSRTSAVIIVDGDALVVISAPDRSGMRAASLLRRGCARPPPRSSRACADGHGPLQPGWVRSRPPPRTSTSWRSR